MNHSALPHLRPAFLASLLGLTALGCSGGSSSGGAPNVILLTIDTTRADFFSCYGFPRESTPNFDALAADGARFELCQSTAAVTPVSHASILTGLFPYEHGLRVMYAPSGYRLPEQIHTLPEVFQAAGYRTGAFLSSYPVSEDFGFDSGFDVFDWTDKRPEEARTVEGDGDSMKWDSTFQRRSDITVDHAIDWLKKPADKSFFMWMHLWDPHGGSAAPDQDLLDKWVPNATSKQIANNMQLRRAYYAAQLEMVDRQFGRLMDQLKASGEYDNTIIVVTADHGEGLGEHGWHAHRILYQEQMHLPLIMHLPGEQKGAVISPQVRTTDVFPTILEAANVAAPAKVSGKSLLPMVRGEETEHRVAYAEQLNQLDANARMANKHPNFPFLFVVSDGVWKYTHRPHAPERDELFNIQDDPEEANNLFGKRKKVLDRLQADLAARNSVTMKPFPKVEGGELPNPDALKGLGYLDGGEDEE